jgi:Holliday junction resolvasome RuvABC endonuclease subunit
MNDEILIAYGIIDLTKSVTPMLCFYQEVKRLIKEYEPEIICWEDLKTDRNADTIRCLGKMVGVLQLICEKLDMKYAQYIPISIRAKLCTIKTGKGGRATKFDLARVLCNKYDIRYPIKKNGEEVTNAQHEFFNKTDAIGIGLYHYRYGNVVKKVKEKKKISKKFDKVIKVIK